MKRIFHLIRKELLQVSRDPNMLRIIFIIPMIQLLVLGYAITTDIKNLNMIVLDLDNTTISRDIIERFSHNIYFNIFRLPYREGLAKEYLLRGEAIIALIIPNHFRKDFDEGRQPQIQILLNGENSNTAAIALGYCNLILQGFMRDTMQKKLLRILFKEQK